MGRKPREKSGIGIYHVMLRGVNRQDIFEDEEDYAVFKKQLHRVVFCKDESGKPQPPRCTIYAYLVVMGTGTWAVPQEPVPMILHLDDEPLKTESI